MGFWGGLLKGIGAVGSIVGAPFTGGASLGALPGILGAGAGIAGNILNRNAGNQSTSTYDPYTMELMRQLSGQGASVLSDYMKDPWAAGFFNQQLAKSSEATGQRAQTLLGNILQPSLNADVSNPSAYRASQIGAIGRGASRERADSFASLLSAAENLRRGSAGAALGYRPLPTGTREKSGSLLGNILGVGGNILMGGFGGGGGANAIPINSVQPGGGLILGGSGSAGMGGYYPGLFG